MVVSKKNILVTGSSGLIGSPLVKKLFVLGFNIIGLDPKQLNIENSKYKHIKKNNLSKEQILEILKKYNISNVIHAGGVSGPMLFNDQPYEIISNNVFTTLNLIEACRIYKKIERVVFCSSISAYGDLLKKNTDENHIFSPTNLYGATKASCDLILEKYYKNYDLDIITLRFSTVYGARRITDCFIKDMINAAKENSRISLPFTSDLKWPYIHVNDAVSSIITSLKHKNNHNYSYNVSGPDFPSYGQITNEIKKYYKDFNPQFSNYNSLTKRELFSIEKIKNDISWKPSFDIKKGIKEFIGNL